MSDNKKEIVSLSTPMDELTAKLLAENNVDELQNIINIFNLNIKKKDIVRTGKLSELQDKISDQIEERLDKHAGEFSNKDLLDYFKVIQDTVSKSDNTLQSIDTPAIQINQNQLNINVDKEDGLDRASREKVIAAVKSMLAKIESGEAPPMDNIQDVEFEVIDEGEDNSEVNVLSDDGQ